MGHGSRANSPFFGCISIVAAVVTVATDRIEKGKGLKLYTQVNIGEVGSHTTKTKYKLIKYSLYK